MKIIRANNLLQFIHQVTVEFKFRKSLAQERYKSDLEFRYQIIVSSIKFRKGFANLTTIEISNDLMNLREIAMPAFIDYVHNYRKVDEHGGSISIWSFVVMIFGTCVLILIEIFMYKKCFHEKVKVYFGERLADCCGHKNVVTSSLSVVENGLVSSEHNKIVRRKSGRQPTSAPDQKEAKGYWLCWRI